LAKLGPGADAVAGNFLFAMIADKDRPQVESLIKGARPQASGDVSDSNE
jgi:hypothetical protein